MKYEKYDESAENNVMHNNEKKEALNFLLFTIFSKSIISPIFVVCWLSLAFEKKNLTKV
jgi:lipid-A-disaccharide synthase-like uncharacterized protein